MNIYDQMKAAGVQIDSHESDLYVPVNEQTTSILMSNIGLKGRLSSMKFVSQIDGKVWYDIPFAYQPWWDARASKG